MEDYIHHSTNYISTNVEKAGDLSVCSIGLKKVEKEKFDGKSMVLKRN